MNWNGSFDCQLWGTTPAYAWRNLDKPRNTSAMVDGVPADIRIEYLPNMSQNRYRLGHFALCWAMKMYGGVGVKFQTFITVELDKG